MSSSSLAHASSPTPTHAPAPSRAIDDAVSGQELRTPQRNVPESSRPNTPSNDHKSMAAVPSTAHVAPAPKTGRLDINALISPPVGVYDNFSSSAAPGALPMMQTDVKLPASGRQDVPPSPPISNQSISPLEQAKHNISPTPSLSVPVKDPILFPNPDASSSPSRIAPLFGTAEQDNEKIINEHIRRAASVLDERQQPTKDEYDLVLLFRSGFMKQFQRDQIGWLNQEKALLAVDRAAWHRARHPPAYHARPVARPQNMTRAQAPKPQQIRSSTTRVQKPAKGKEPRITKPQPAPRPIRTSPGSARGTTRVSSTPEPRTRTVAPNREDKDFNSIPNYTPPLESLGNKALKVDWKGNPLDLSRDPYAYLLHPEELKLAASLRLDCATYLTSKRRIFEARRNCAMRTPPKPFRKTDAQQACKIDVNKASKLWTAYDSVGWLDERWVFPSR